ncbi:MAG: rhomboid family intramembrane serine protease [Candidatus Bathyarchaeia archaeon]
MLLPIRDENRSLTTPHLTRLILALNIVLFSVYWLSVTNTFLDNSLANLIEQNFIMIPNKITHEHLFYTLFTSMFMHANWAHLLGNMLYLYIFGDNVEDAFGHTGYLIFYIACGLAATFAHIMSLATPSEFAMGVLGASGAISGILGAYLVLYPRAKILTLVFFVWPRIVSIPAIGFLIFWFIMQWLYGFLEIESGVAYWAHIGGFVAGMILALIFARRK